MNEMIGSGFLLYRIDHRGQARAKKELYSCGKEREKGCQRGHREHLCAQPRNV